METKHEFKLTFGTNKGSEITVSIPRADSAKQISDLQDAMTAIMETKIVQTAAGEPDSMQHAELVSTEMREYEVA